MIREPAVAGYFYPSHSEELSGTVKKYISDGGVKSKALGMLVPHAGYIYSGKTAGVVYGGVKLPRRIIALGPNHTGAGPAISVYPKGEWKTPLGNVSVDEALGSALIAECPDAKSDTLAHREEHSIEVQLPFLQVLLPEFRILPVIVGRTDYGSLRALGEALARVVHAADEEIMLLVSSDMTHYESAESARSKDRFALEAMEKLNADDLHSVVTERRISMCGFAPAVSALAALRTLGATRGEVLDYSNSGDRSGDYSAVVAYAGMRFY